MQSLKIHHYSNLHVLDITNLILIGGPFSSQLRGPIPVNLLPVGVVVVGMNGGPPAPPFHNFQLPKYTKLSAGSANPNNWIT